jgi:dethiobiotin synthetase
MAPFLFEPACSPHLASRLCGRPVDVDRILACARRLAARRYALVVEGAGGVLVPIDESRTMLDLMAALRLPVVLASPGGLGAINQALLSLEAIRGRGLRVAGVVLNETRPVPEGDRFLHDDNARAIAEFGRTTVLARIPFLGERPDWKAMDPYLAGIDPERILLP